MDKENSKPNVRVKLQTLTKVSNRMFKQGDIVWVNLGISYSWWPGEFQEIIKKTDKKSSDSDLKINVSDNPFKKSKEDLKSASDKKEPFKVGEVK